MIGKTNLFSVPPMFPIARCLATLFLLYMLMHLSLAWQMYFSLR